MSVIDSSQVVVSQSPVVSGLPSDFFIEYFGKVKASGRWFVVVRPEKDWDYDDFVVLMNDGMSVGCFKSLKVGNVVRYRDGGTTEIETDAGNFFFPTCFEPQKKATFAGQELDIYNR